MSVGSVSITVEGGTATATTESNNTVGIILGIVIPIVVLCK